MTSKFDYGDKTRGLSYEENNFLHSLVCLGYEVIAFDYLSVIKEYGKKMMNRILIESLYRWNPDLVFFVLFEDEVEGETLIEIRDTMGIKTLNWFCDDHWRFDSFSKYYAPYFSYIVTTYRKAVEKYKQIGYENVIFSQWACNHFLYRKLDLPYKYDVSFVGQPHGDRKIVIKKFEKAGLKVDTWGFGWPRGKISTYEMIKVFNQSKINLNLSNASVGNINQIKGRDFEIPGCGGFMITGHSDELENYFRIDEEIVTYLSIDDLIDKCKYYLANKERREQIAKRGYNRVLREHTYVSRFNEIFNKIFLKSKFNVYLRI